MLRIYGAQGCGPCEVTKLSLNAKRIPFDFVDVASAPDKRRELKEKLGSPTSGVILEDGDRLEVMQGVSVARLSRYLTEYEARHPLTP